MLENANRLQSWDKILLLLFPVIAMIVSTQLINSYALSTVLFYGLPGIYLSFRFGQVWQIKKVFLFAILFTIPFTIVVDYIGIKSGLWYTPTSSLIVRFLNTTPWEDFLWMIVGAYTIVMIYETLINQGKQELINRRALYFLLPAVIIIVVFFFILTVFGSEVFVFHGKYTYLILASIFFLSPALLFIIKFPEYLKKFLPISMYFLYLTIFFEITATYLNQWIFTGQYLIQPLNIFGNTPIPYEELFFVGIIGPMTAVSLYEFFDKDVK